jgi:hypothetical protein
MQPEANNLDRVSAAMQRNEPATRVTEADVKHLREEANRTWDVLQHDLEGYPHHPAA